MAVEFVHPVIVGKRALPAIGLTDPGADALAGSRGRRHRDRGRHATRATRTPRRRSRRGRARLPDRRLGPAGAAGTSTRPATTRSCARSWPRRSTTCSGSWCTCSSTTAACSRGARPARPTTRAARRSSTRSWPSSSTTWRRSSRTSARSVLMKADEIARAARPDAGRATATSWSPPRRPCARRFDAGGTLLALGNGGSATDAQDAVADLRAAPQGWPAAPRARPGRGPGDPHRDRQRHRRGGDLRPPGDRLRARGRRRAGALHQRQLGATSSRPWREARRRGLRTVAMVGYDGGRVAARGARRPRRRHPLGAHPAHPGGPGERLARPEGARRARACRDGRAARPRAGGGHGAGGGLPPVRPPPGHATSASRASSSTTPPGSLLEVEVGPAARWSASWSGSAADAPPLASVERVEPERAAPRSATRGFAILASEPGAGEPVGRRRPRRRHLRRLPGRAARPRRPPLPLPVRQLHRLRPPLHDRPRRPLRPRAAPRWPASRCATSAAPSTRTPPTAASTPSPSPARTAARRLARRQSGRHRRARRPRRRRRGGPRSMARSWP